MELLKVKVDGQWVEVPSIKGEKGEKGDAFTYADFTEAQKMALIQGPIKTAQDAAVDVVEDAGSDQVAAVEAKGEEVRESIPADYTELSENVSALNSALTTKADKIGSSPDLIAGTAEQLMSSEVVEDAVPYLYRKSGGGLDIGNREKLEKIVGGTVAWNQLARNSNAPTSRANLTIVGLEDGFTITGTASEDTSASGWFGFANPSPIAQNHVCMSVFALVSGTVSNSNSVQISLTGTSEGIHYLNSLKVFRATALPVNSYLGIANGTVFTDAKLRVQLFDLTQMLGPTIADYIYSLEQANAGAGVAWFRKLFPKDYYPYNAGELISVSGLSEHKMVGLNLWDEEWEAYGGNQIKSKNRIKMIPGATYYAKTPSVGISLYFKENETDNANVGQVTVVNNTFVVPSNGNYAVLYTAANYGTTYNHDICINFSDPSRNGEYEPYKKHSYPLDSSLTLRGIPKLDSENKLYYDGDEYTPDGAVTRRYGVVDLGTLTWNRITDDSFAGSPYFSLPNGLALRKGGSSNILCAKYVTQTSGRGEIQNGCIASWNTTNSTSVAIRDDSYTDVTTFKAAMSGVYLVYELATPTTETAEPYTEIQIVDPYGTEEFVSDSIVPVGHSTKYPADLVKKLEGLPWNFATLIAPTESSNKATRPYTVGNYLILNNTLYKVTSAIANGGTITPGTNVTATTIMAELAALA